MRLDKIVIDRQVPRWMDGLMMDGFRIMVVII